MYHPGVCTIQEYVPSRSMYYPGVCTIQEYVPSRSMYHPGLCTIQEYVLFRSMYCPGVHVLSRSMYHPGVCAIHVLTKQVWRHWIMYIHTLPSKERVTTTFVKCSLAPPFPSMTSLLSFSWRVVYYAVHPLQYSTTSYSTDSHTHLCACTT
jgi:hypothetical protein